ncbi:MAG: hypothetical protein M0C28_27185 [Candidatus Moduliflexus flocculans]|nr:hypothetical protein [Candidatus Moduliflexus flocculans]
MVRPEQGPVPEVQLQDHEDPALRRVLLPPGSGDGQDGLSHGRALVRPPVPDVQSRAQGPPAPHPLRQQPRVPADDGHPGGPRRGHGRLHRVVQAPHRPALRGVSDRDRPRHRPRARPRLPVRHHGHRAIPTRPGATTPPCASRSGSSRAWPSTCRSDPSIRTPRCGCATPSGARSCLRSRSSTTPTSSSPTAGARPSGPTSPAAGATRSSARR